MVIAIVLTDFEHAREIIKEKENDKCYFELRLDADPRLLLLVTENVVSPSRVILTVRTKAQGGKLETGNKRRVLLDHSLELDVEYLDLELITDSERLQNLIENPEKLNPINLIVSHHNFDQVMKPGFFE
ncbi:MAG: type I 3-dehydroquinate dehydratase, partial [Candidatus Heimdallarchaeota archaeon]